MNVINSLTLSKRIVSKAWQAWLAHRRRRAAQLAFERLDARTLRDLGLGRDDFGAWCAEAEGRVERTLLRVIRLHESTERP